MLELNVFKHFLAAVQNVGADCLACGWPVPFLQRSKHIPVVVDGHTLVETSVRTGNQRACTHPQAIEQAGQHRHIGNFRQRVVEFMVVGQGRRQIIIPNRAFASQPVQQKNFVEAIPYGPSNINAMDLVDETIGKKLPTAPENLQNARATDAEFWIEHGEDLEERFNAWVSK